MTPGLRVKDEWCAFFFLYLLLFTFISDCWAGHCVTRFICSCSQTQACATTEYVGVCTGRSRAAAVWGEGVFSESSSSVPGLCLIWLLDACSASLGIQLMVKAFRCCVLPQLYINCCLLDFAHWTVLSVGQKEVACWASQLLNSQPSDLRHAKCCQNPSCVSDCLKWPVLVRRPPPVAGCMSPCRWPISAIWEQGGQSAHKMWLPMKITCCQGQAASYIRPLTSGRFDWEHALVCREKT